ncbi:MAG: T9SS type A sorting domain-containing protein [Bacteroidota bacterium]
MKAIYTAFALILLPCLSFAQIPNFSFEDWSNFVSYDNPDHWASMNSITAGVGQFTCEMGTPGNPGNYFMKLTSRTLSGLGTVPGIAVCGVLNTTSRKPVSGFPYSDRPASFKGKWQFMAYGEDQGFISVVLSKWNIDTHQRDTVAYIDQALKGMQMSWASFDLEFNYINYLSSGAPDSALIFCSASNAHNAPTANYSYLWLDSLAFAGTVGGMEERNRGTKFIAYPNPTTAILNISFSEKQIPPLSYFIIDELGQTYNPNILKQGHESVTVDVATYHPGIYSFVIQTRDNIRTTRFIIKR